MLYGRRPPRQRRPSARSGPWPPDQPSRGDGPRCLRARQPVHPRPSKATAARRRAAKRSGWRCPAGDELLFFRFGRASEWQRQPQLRGASLGGGLGESYFDAAPFQTATYIGRQYRSSFFSFPFFPSFYAFPQESRLRCSERVHAGHAQFFSPCEDGQRIMTQKRIMVHIDCRTRQAVGARPGQALFMHAPRKGIVLCCMVWPFFLPVLFLSWPRREEKRNNARAQWPTHLEKRARETAVEQGKGLGDQDAGQYAGHRSQDVHRKQETSTRAAQSAVLEERSVFFASIATVVRCCGCCCLSLFFFYLFVFLSLFLFPSGLFVQAETGQEACLIFAAYPHSGTLKQRWRRQGTWQKTSPRERGGNRSCERVVSSGRKGSVAGVFARLSRSLGGVASHDRPGGIVVFISLLAVLARPTSTVGVGSQEEERERERGGEKKAAQRLFPLRAHDDGSWPL